MAYIVKYEKGASYQLSTRSSEPVDVNCKYEVQSLPNGSKRLVIKTYNPQSLNGGISQVIHFTKDSAIKLIDIFKQEFDI